MTITKVALLNDGNAKNIFMVIFIVLWPYLLTTKLRCLQKNNIGHTRSRVILCPYVILFVKITQNYDLINLCMTGYHNGANFVKFRYYEKATQFEKKISISFLN